MQMRKENLGRGLSQCRVGNRMLQIPSTFLLARELNDQLVAWGAPQKRDVVALDVLRINVLLSQWGVLLDEHGIAHASSSRGDGTEVSLSFLPWWNQTYVNRLYMKTQDDMKKGRVERHGDQYGLEIYTGPERSYFCYEADGSSVVIYRVPAAHGQTGYRVGTVLWDGYELGYTFTAKYLSDWRRIDQGLRTLFESFVVAE